MSRLLRSPARARLDSSAAYAPGSIGASLAGMPSVADFPWLAVGDGVTDNEAAFLAAAADVSGPLRVPDGSFVVNVQAANVATILGLLDRLRCDGAVTINLPSGTAALVAEVLVSSPDADRITVLGAAPVQTTAVSFVGVAGAAKAYSVTIEVASSAGVSVNDYAIVQRDVTGTGDFYAHAGCWKVAAVDAGGPNRLTLLNTNHRAAFPANTLTGGTVKVLKTVLQFTGCDGFRFEGAQPLALLDQVAIVGDWNVAAATGTTGTHGIVVASPVIAGGGDSNAAYNPSGMVTLGRTVGVSGWGEQGVVISVGGLVGNNLAVSSCRKRGLYTEAGGYARCKFAVSSGNGEDGYISDFAHMQVSSSIASGNGLNGYWATNNGGLFAASSVASGNLASGFESRGSGRLGADATKAIGNTLDGYTASDDGMIDADSAQSDGNLRHGFYSVVNATIDANNASSTNNGQYGARSISSGVINLTGAGSVTGNGTSSYSTEQNGEVIQPDGTLYTGGRREGGTQRIYNSDRSHYAEISVSSIGDVSISIDGSQRQLIKVGAGTRIIGNAPTTAAGELGMGAQTQTTVGAAGVAAALPANPLGYLIWSVGGTSIKVPYYNV